MDPHSEDIRVLKDASGSPVTCQSHAQYDQILRSISKQLYERNIAAGKSGIDALSFCLIQRSNPRHHVWPRLHGPACGPGLPVCGGDVDHVGAACDGRFRIATIAEEILRRKQDAEDALAAKGNTNRQNLSKQFMEAVQEAFKNA